MGGGRSAHVGELGEAGGAGRLDMFSRADGLAVRDAHRIWEVGEPVHAVIYFHPMVGRFAEDAGCHGFWMGYVGMRAAPLGAVSAAAVTSTFYNFAPRRIHRAVPDAWTFSSPRRLLDARLAAIDAVLRELWGLDTTGASVRRAEDLAGRAAAAVVTAGRPLAAANASLPVPAPPHLALWQALTVLREHRGDGHIASLVYHEVGPCEALVLSAATRRSPAEQLRTSRGWTEDEWAAATANLVERGWLTSDGAATKLGSRMRGEIEDATDTLAAAPYRMLSPRERDELHTLLYELADRVARGGGFSWPNPIGLNWPPRVASGDVF